MAEQERKAEEERQRQLAAAVKKRSDNLQYSGIFVFILLLFITTIFFGLRKNPPSRGDKGGCSH